MCIRDRPIAITLDQDIENIFNTFELTNDDYKVCIDKHKDTPNVLFLADPPYFCTDKTYKENYFNVDEYITMI